MLLTGPAMVSWCSIGVKTPLADVLSVLIEPLGVVRPSSMQ